MKLFAMNIYFLRVKQHGMACTALYLFISNQKITEIKGCVNALEQ